MACYLFISKILLREKGQKPNDCSTRLGAGRSSTPTRGAHAARREPVGRRATGGLVLDPEPMATVAPPRAAAIPAAADTAPPRGPGHHGSRDPAATDTGTARGGDPLTACPPETPYQLSPTLCVDQTLIDQIEAGWQVHIDPAGNVTLIPRPSTIPTPANGETSIRRRKDATPTSR